MYCSYTASMEIYNPVAMEIYNPVSMEIYNPVWLGVCVSGSLYG